MTDRARPGDQGAARWGTRRQTASQDRTTSGEADTAEAAEAAEAADSGWTRPGPTAPRPWPALARGVPGSRTGRWPAGVPGARQGHAAVHDAPLDAGSLAAAWPEHEPPGSGSPGQPWPEQPAFRPHPAPVPGTAHPGSLPYGNAGWPHRDAGWPSADGGQTAARQAGWQPPEPAAPDGYRPALPAARREREEAHDPRALRLPAMLVFWMVLVLVFLLAGVIVAFVGVTSGKVPAAGPPQGGGGGLAPAVTLAGARQVLARYQAASTKANQARSDSDLGAIEGGSSYALDAGQYRWERADPGSTGYAPLAPDDPAYYVPLLARTAWPRWFAVRVRWTAEGGPHPGPEDTGYIVFTQAARGSPWKDQLEPYTVTGAGQAPQVALSAAGYATAVAPQAAAGLAAPPAALPARTAAVLNGSARGLTIPGTLGDVKDETFWRKELPAGSTVSEAHADAPGVYALRTAGGGALVLYSGTAILHLAPPAGQTFALSVPGFYSPGQAESSARLAYAEQFASIDPPPGHGSPYVIADTSGIQA